jgi:hypothetical protein
MLNESWRDETNGLDDADKCEWRKEVRRAGCASRAPRRSGKVSGRAARSTSARAGMEGRAGVHRTTCHVLCTPHHVPCLNPLRQNINKVRAISFVPPRAAT